MDLGDKHPKSTLTCVVNVYHQQPGDDAKQFTNSTSKQLSSEEECYTRTMNIGSDWVDLDFGWVEKPCLLWLENKTGSSSTTLPTEQEKQAIREAVIQVDPCGLFIAPKGVNLISPGKYPIRVRSLGIEAKLKLAAFEA